MSGQRQFAPNWKQPEQAASAEVATASRVALAYRPGASPCPATRSREAAPAPLPPLKAEVAKLRWLEPTRPAANPGQAMAQQSLLQAQRLPKSRAILPSFSLASDDGGAALRRAATQSLLPSNSRHFKHMLDERQATGDERCSIAVD